MIGIKEVTTAEGKTYQLGELAEMYYERLKKGTQNIGCHRFVKGESDSKITALKAKIESIKDSHTQIASELLEVVDGLQKEKQRKELITASPEDLEEYTKYSSSYINTLSQLEGDDKKGFSKTVKPLYDEILDILDYKSMRSNDIGLWLAKQLNIRSCLYCNAQSTLTIDAKVNEATGEVSGSGKALFQFDHFFPKSIYPYLSLSFYNLVPSCASCNQGKSSEPASLNTHFHPYYRDSLDFNFQVSPTSAINSAIQGMRSFDDLVIQPPYENPNTLSSMEEKHLKLYRLDHIYQEYKDLAGEIYAKAHIYNDSYREEILNLFNEASSNTLTEEELNRLIVGNYIEDGELHKRSLSKFMKDIAKDSGLI